MTLVNYKKKLNKDLVNLILTNKYIYLFIKVNSYVHNTCINNDYWRSSNNINLQVVGNILFYYYLVLDSINIISSSLSLLFFYVIIFYKYFNCIST